MYVYKNDFFFSFSETYVLMSYWIDIDDAFEQKMQGWIWKSSAMGQISKLWTFHI